MEVLGFHHLAIGVRDLAKVGAFYREVLGLAELKRHSRETGQLRSIWFSLPGGGFVALEQKEDAAPGNSFLVLSLRISAADRLRVIAELERRCIPVTHQTQWTVYFKDPEGNPLALSHYPQDSPTPG